MRLVGRFDVDGFHVTILSHRTRIRNRSRDRLTEKLVLVCVDCGYRFAFAAGLLNLGRVGDVTA